MFSPLTSANLVKTFSSVSTTVGLRFRNVLRPLQKYLLETFKGGIKKKKKKDIYYFPQDFSFIIPT